MARNLSMAEAARRFDRHYDTFRKEWRALVRDQGFPAPVRVGVAYQWRPADLDAWEARAQAESQLQVLVAPKAANCDRPALPGAVNRRVDAARMAALHRMQAGLR